MTASIKFECTTKASGIDWNYVTLQPCVIVFDIPHSSIGGAFRNAWLSIQPTYSATGRETVTAVISKSYAWDGASCVPDLSGVIESTVIHDPVYQFVEEIARAWGWPVKRVLSLGNLLFDLLMRHFKVSDFARWVYSSGVSIFGYTFNRFNAWRSRLNTQRRNRP